VETAVKMQYNSQIFNDTLIQVANATEYGNFAPIVTISKEMTMTKTQADEIFQPVKKMIIIKWCTFAGLLALGVLCWYLNCMYRSKRQSMYYQIIVQKQMFEQLN